MPSESEFDSPGALLPENDDLSGLLVQASALSVEGPGFESWR